MNNLKLLSELATMAASLEEVGRLFSLTDDQLKDPQCGKYIIERIKQYQTAYTIRKEMASAKHDFPKAPEINVTQNESMSETTQ